MKLPKNLHIEIDAFSIAQIGNEQLYALVDQELQKVGIFNIGVTDMELKPVSIVRKSNEVRYKCIIKKFNITK
ncbi:hypothetical protein [Cysteiniphilum marinum]|uniref:hypothetical protein n=1 Tax=Cysteiniphilum marinum TaxID=2774191 RepID=UPI00193A7281|nr:hypothetical protein [Cysteiniphilum marinum]